MVSSASDQICLDQHRSPIDNASVNVPIKLPVPQPDIERSDVRKKHKY
jgi:hypothetical protein